MSVAWLVKKMIITSWFGLRFDFILAFSFYFIIDEYQQNLF